MSLSSPPRSDDDDDDGDITTPAILPVHFQINEKRERERSGYFQPHADSCAAPRTCSYPEKQREREEEERERLTSLSIFLLCRRDISAPGFSFNFFFFSCCCGFYTVFTVASSDSLE